MATARGRLKALVDARLGIERGGVAWYSTGRRSAGASTSAMIPRQTWQHGTDDRNERRRCDGLGSGSLRDRGVEDGRTRHGFDGMWRQLVRMLADGRRVKDYPPEADGGDRAGKRIVADSCRSR